MLHILGCHKIGVSNFKQAAPLKLGSLRENIVLYKTGRLFLANYVLQSDHPKNKKNQFYISFTKIFESNHLFSEMRAATHLNLR